MKKSVYMAPEMETVIINMSGMLCVSTEGSGTGSEPVIGGEGNPDDPADDPA